LEQLLQTPQNNLRLFVRHGAASREEAELADDDGGWVQMVDLRDAQQIAQLVALLLPRMAPPTPTSASAAASTPSSSTSSPHQQLLLSFLTSFLTRTPAMRALFAHLQHLQQQLDYIDIEGAFPFYEELCEHAPAALVEERLWQGVHLHEPQENEGSALQHEPQVAACPPPVPAWVPALLGSLGRPGDEASTATVTAITTRSSSVFAFPPREGDAAALSSSPSNTTPLCARWGDSAGTSPTTPCAPVPARLPLAMCGPAVACETRRDVGGSDGGSTCRCSALHAMRAFLLSTTLKDVSIMCTMQSDETEEPGAGAAANDSAAASVPSASASSDSSCRVHYSVRLIDLECKSVDKMREYHRLDKHIVQFYNQQLQQRRSSPSS
jgi:hypothetical protein